MIREFESRPYLQRHLSRKSELSMTTILALVVGWAIGRYQDKIVETVKGWLGK